MPVLGFKKAPLLNQLKRGPVSLDDLANFIRTYDDLSINDLRGIVDDSMLAQLEDLSRNPEEMNLWNEITSTPRPSIQDADATQRIQALQQKVQTYITRFASAPKAMEASQLIQSLQNELHQAISYHQERQEWESLLGQRGNYARLNEYKNRYPNSVHLDELDDMMWDITKSMMNEHSLRRYLSSWPMGRHSNEAQQALNESAEWTTIKREGDIMKVKKYLDSHTGSPLYPDISSVFYQLRDAEMERMKENPAEISKDVIMDFLNNGIFSRYDLEDAQLITEESWETLLMDRNMLPDLRDYQKEDPNIQALADCTDVYLFGTPGTGKTCLLMGLAGANGHRDSRGNTYILDLKANGGPYASALQQYVQAGISPENTPGNFVTTIHGSVTENHKNKMVSHKINLVEMSGEEFRDRIAENQAVSLAEMGTGATNLLRNKNRKVFFIIIDCSRDKVKVIKEIKERDFEGNIIGTRTAVKFVSQLDIINKFVSLFMQPENQGIMDCVDAIHFVVTKADMLGDETVRGEKARELLLTKYIGPVEMLKEYCRRSKRINYSSEYRPKVYTFSLGQFYLGNVFEFNNSETLKIVDVIRSVTGGERERGWWDTFRDWLG